MSKKRFAWHALSVSILTVPNLIYLLCNIQVLKEANAIALTLSALLVLSIVGMGALAHFRPKSGIWVTIIGMFILSLSNIAYISGIALIIEGCGLIVDGYAINPIIVKLKIRELEASGRNVSYTTQL